MREAAISFAAARVARAMPVARGRQCCIAPLTDTRGRPLGLARAHLAGIPSRACGPAPFIEGHRSILS